MSCDVVTDRHVSDENSAEKGDGGPGDRKDYTTGNSGYLCRGDQSPQTWSFPR